MDQNYFFPIQLSLIVSFSAALAVFFSGVLVGKLFTIKSFKGKIILETILMLPLVLPPSVIGYSLILIFGANSAIGQVFETRNRKYHPVHPLLQ
ncbi:ABC-type molybdate transport system permease subunit [Peribacillus huizhouensis]|uniref:ABC-type molybdate transport system permease subunit n=1 Tax=Peribacillus huizhouensis TaxID=1501239 RepID=A0ABR6CVD2_9BACI|nr:ABC-type molybdate transport system permease subunit [Peribacillus huizhouensis]